MFSLGRIHFILQFNRLALVAEMGTKHGQAFKMNYTVKRGFHVTLMIPNRAVTFDFPAEIEVVSFNFVAHLLFDKNHFLVQLQIQTLKSLLIFLNQSAGNQTQYMLFDDIRGEQTQYSHSKCH